MSTNERSIAFTTGILDENLSEKGFSSKPETIAAAFHEVLEIGVPFEELDCAEEDRIEFYMTISAQGLIGERWPMYGTFIAELPGKDFEMRMWEV